MKLAVPLRALAAGAGLLAAGCQSLPEYARPRTEVIDPESYTATDVILYRALTRDDFRATSPPSTAVEAMLRMGAFTCASLISQDDATLEVSRSPDGKFEARVHEMHFYAEMDRECSWWNPEGTGLPAEYLLEHEQIHFALVELKARAIGEEVGRMEARADSGRAAAEAIQQQVSARIRAAGQELGKESLAFDEDTSGVYAPERQARWRERVEKRLRETAP